MNSILIVNTKKERNDLQYQIKIKKDLLQSSYFIKRKKYMYSGFLYNFSLIMSKSSWDKEISPSVMNILMKDSTSPVPVQNIHPSGEISLSHMDTHDGFYESTVWSV